MAIAIRDNHTGQSNGSTAASIDLAFPSDILTGSLLIAFVSDYSQTPPSGGVTGDLNSAGTYAYAFTRACVCGGGANQTASAIYYLANAPAGHFHVKYTPAASNYIALAIQEITGANTSSPLDNTQITATFKTDATPEPDANVTYVGNAVVAMGFSDPGGTNDTLVPGTGYTEVFTSANGMAGTIFGAEVRIISTGAGNDRAYMTYGVSLSSWYSCGASFKEAAAGGATASVTETLNFAEALD
jgi:hypothetical protein